MFLLNQISFNSIATAWLESFFAMLTRQEWGVPTDDRSSVIVDLWWCEQWPLNAVIIVFKFFAHTVLEMIPIWNTPTGANKFLFFSYKSWCCVHCFTITPCSLFTNWWPYSYLFGRMLTSYVSYIWKVIRENNNYIVINSGLMFIFKGTTVERDTSLCQRKKSNNNYHKRKGF